MVSSTPQPARFTTTRWSVVVAAGGEPSPQSAAALATLCETYWYPLYVFLRRQGISSADAQDLTQEFFATLLEKHYLEAADRERGRFRSFLLLMLKRFLSKQREREQALKRGGGRLTLSLDFDSAENRYRLEPADVWTPEKAYQRRWALTLLDRVLARLEAEYVEKGKAELFERCRVFLTGSREEPSYQHLAEALAMTPGAVKVSIHRLRQRYRDLLQDEIAQTVASPEEVRDELNDLLAALHDENP